MDMVFGKLEGLSGIADDTFVYGIGEAEHDQRILNVLDTARENNVRFNPDKFSVQGEGIRPDENKIKAIHNMPPPKNLTELQSFMV